MNIRLRSILNVARSLCALTLMCAATGVPAQTVHRQVDAAGRVTFTDRPKSTPSTQTMIVASSDVDYALSSRSIISSRSAAAIDAKEATRRLAVARQGREQGAEPLPGERAKSDGEIVVNHRYWRRQEILRRMVEQALQRSNETRRLHIASR